MLENIWRIQPNHVFILKHLWQLLIWPDQRTETGNFFSFLGGKGRLVTAESLAFLLLSGVLGGRDHPLTGGPAGITKALSLRSTPTTPAPVAPNHSASCWTLCWHPPPTEKPIIFFRDTGSEPRSVNKQVPYDFRARGQGGAQTASDRPSKRRLKNWYLVSFFPATMNTEVQVKHTDT